MSSTILRIGRLREILPVAAGDSILITDLTDIRYLTGFTGSNGWLLVTDSTVRLITDGRYVEQARSQTDVDVVEARTVAEMVTELNRDRSTRLMFQSGQVSVDLFDRLKSVTDQLLPIGSRLADLRRAKDPTELAAIERAVRCADLALADVCPSIDDSMTEKGVRDELEYRMRRHGADGPSYDTIVASGPVNSARPHHRPSSRRLEEGDLIVIDVGALVDGYHSDLTRTFALGGCSDELRERYEIVRESQRQGVNAVRAGIRTRDIDQICRGVFRSHDLEDDFVHGTGHGVGLVIHEEPFLGPTSTATLSAGDVVTVEPGLYRVGLGGVRIEDLLAVNETGSRVLSTFPKDLICLPSRPTI
ncbi:MAG: aminopeptidase P family protein [Actinobacteria bacterium]|nr:aminopeptidase P family protein [Actinomycetota bacterium]